MTGSNRRTALAAAALVASAALAACSQGSTSAAPGGGGGGGDQTATKKASDIVVGYAGPTLTNAFFVGLEKGVKDGAKANGFQLKETNANGDAAQQFNDATNLLNQGVDVLVLTPIDSNGITPVVQAANAKNVPVFTLDRGASGGTITCFVETNNKKAGEEAATWIAGQLNKRYGKAQGNVVDLVGLVGTTAAADREAGFQTGLKANPGLKPWPSRRADSTRRVAQRDEQHPAGQQQDRRDLRCQRRQHRRCAACHRLGQPVPAPDEQVAHPHHRSGRYGAGPAGDPGR